MTEYVTKSIMYDTLNVLKEFAAGLTDAIDTKVRKIGGVLRDVKYLLENHEERIRMLEKRVELLERDKDG